MQKRKSKLIVKDADGQLIQLLPEVALDSNEVAHGNATVNDALLDIDSAIQNLELAVSNNDDAIKSVFTEIEGKSQTAESETVHTLLDGWIGSSVSSEAFKIIASFGYMSGGSGGSYNSITKNATTFTHTGTEGDRIDDRRVLKSNVRYSCTFSFDSTYTFTALSLMTSQNTVTTLENDQIASGRYGVVGDEIISSSEYTSWTFDDSFIALTFPSVGNSIQLKFNGMFSNGSWNAISTPTMFAELTHTASTSYKLDFWWEYEEDRIVDSSTRWKELKTTMVLPDDTERVAVKPIVGLLQDIKGTSEDAFDYKYASGNSGTVSSVSQVKTINVAKEDANGSITTERIAMKPSTVVSYSTSQASVGDVVEGFVCGVDPASLALGGLYLEVESTFETQD